jgi:hypothetical protein
MRQRSLAEVFAEMTQAGQRFDSASKGIELSNQSCPYCKTLYRLDQIVCDFCPEIERADKGEGKLIKHRKVPPALR